MGRPNVFATETRLWHPAEGWRAFPAGETDPGLAWSAKEGGEPVGIEATAGALKDLNEANARLDQMSQTIGSMGHDLAVMAKDRDGANDKVHDLEQRAIAAETAQGEAETAARGYMTERDQARAELQGANDKLVAAGEAANTVAGTIERLTDELNAANQATANALARAEEAEAALSTAKAEIAKVDGDKDGKVGGSTTKAGK